MEIEVQRRTKGKDLKEISVPDSVLVMVETIDEKSSEHDFLLELLTWRW